MFLVRILFTGEQFLHRVSECEYRYDPMHDHWAKQPRSMVAARKPWGAYAISDTPHSAIGAAKVLLESAR